MIKMGEKRKVLEGVPKVAFAPIHDGKWEFTPFPSCLKACLKYLNHNVPYHYLLSTTGAAFRFVWHSKRWEGGNVDIMAIDKNPFKPFKSGFDSAGYKTEIFWNESSMKTFSNLQDLSKTVLQKHSANEETFKETILKQINAGIPVIGLGVVGPPEASIITGYDNYGETLIGWSLFQEHLDPSLNIDQQEEEEFSFPPTGVEDSGYFRQDDWFRKTIGILTIGEKIPVEYSTIYRKTLEWIVEIIKTPMINEYYTGLKAYDAYIEKMQDDSEFPKNDRKMLRERKMVHYDAMTMISERGGGARFLNDIASHIDFKKVADDLQLAAKAFQDSASQMESWWQVVGEIWADEEKQIAVMADSEKRQAFIPYIKTSRDKDKEAVELIEKVLKTLDK
jgi:hypothetical protein